MRNHPWLFSPTAGQAQQGPSFGARGPQLLWLLAGFYYQKDAGLSLTERHFMGWHPAGLETAPAVGMARLLLKHFPNLCLQPSCNHTPINPGRGKCLSSAVHAVLLSLVLLINYCSQAQKCSCASLPGGPQRVGTAAGGIQRVGATVEGTRVPWPTLCSLGPCGGTCSPPGQVSLCEGKSLSQRDPSQICFISCFTYL